MAPTGPGPSRDGLQLILAGTAYLLAICVLQLVMLVDTTAGLAILPKSVTGVRDVVALFGWVGLMISGVGVIIVPNHLKVRLRPTSLPRVHLLFANVGLLGYLVLSISATTGVLPLAFLAVTSASFLAFGAGFLRTILPFARGPPDRGPGGVGERIPTEHVA